MIKEIIRMLKSKGLEFDKGLTEQEIIRIKQQYNIELPKELKELYMNALPISKGFYNWKDFSYENTRNIKETLDRPFNDIYEMANEVYWCDDWGEEPEEKKKADIIREMLKKAPALIPIYSHRYMPAIDLDNMPVISIHDTDIIYYGENLLSYFQIEFGNKNQGDINYDTIKYVPFWSDLL